MPRRLSLDEQVLLAAADLEANGHSPFTAEDMVVAAWKNFPDSFALEGYPQYPDSNRVYTKLMGRRGLAGRGWLVKVSQKRYQLSEAGRINAKSLGTGIGLDAASRAALSRDQKRLLAKLLSSRAVAKVGANGVEGLGFHDACSFWDVSSRSNASILRARLQSVEAILDAAEIALREHGELALVQGDRSVGAGEVETLRRTHQILLERFKEDLGIIRRRQDERKFR